MKARSRPTDQTTDSSEPTELVFGRRAVLATHAVRPSEILSVFYTDDVAEELQPLLAWAESAGVEAQETRDVDIERFALTKHHEGVCIETRPRQWLSPTALAELLLKRKGACLALDRVRNPHNVGAILRTAAFFGVDAALLGSPAPHPALDPEAVRVAEGGAERLALARTTDLADTLKRMRARGIEIAGAEHDAPASAFESAWRRPCILVVGHEREGLSDRVREQCTTVVSIPGTGKIDSLNVSVAAGVLVCRLVRPVETPGT